MTIKLLTPRDLTIGGRTVTYPAGALVTLDAATETGLINSKEATATLTGGIAYTPPVPSGQPVPLTVIPSAQGVTKWDVEGAAITGHVTYSALPKLNNHLRADGKVYSISAYPGLARRLGRVCNGISAFATRTTTNDRPWLSVCWSPELMLFVAVAETGTGNRVMTSPDGIVWTSRTSAVDNAWQSVCWTDVLGLFVAVSSDGTGNRVMTSPDGIVWTQRASAADNVWQSVCWSRELSMIVSASSDGAGNRVMTAYGCTYNPLTDFAVPKITAPAGCYSYVFAG